MEPSFSFVIPTTGRPTLVHTLESLGDGITRQDEVVVVDDRPAGGDPDLVSGMVQRSGLAGRVGRLVVLEPECHLGMWGHPASNMAMREASGSHVLRIDDDDEYVEGALPEIRAWLRADPRSLHIWRMRTRAGAILWAEPVLRISNVGTPMVVVPLEHVGRWGDRYEGDFDYIEESARRVLSSGRAGVVWHTELMVLCG